MYEFDQHEIEYFEDMKKEYLHVDLTLEDVCDLVASALEGGIGYWACLDNTTANFEAMETKYPDACINEILMHILCYHEPGVCCHDVVCFIDEEDDNERYGLELSMLLGGIQDAISQGYWNGDMWTQDSIIADIVFQLALFGEVRYS